MTSPLTETAQGGHLPELRSPGALLARLKALILAPDDRARAKRDALHAFAVRIVGAAILYLSQVVLARWMGGHEYGLFVAVSVWVAVLGGLAQLGLGTMSMRLASEHAERGEHDDLRGLLLANRLVALLAGTAVMVGSLLVLWVSGERAAGPALLPAFLMLTCIPIIALMEIHDGVGRGLRWFGLALWPIYVIRPLSLLGVMAIAYMAGLPMNAVTAAGAAVVSTWATGLLQAVLMQRAIRNLVPPGKRRMSWRLWTTASAPLLLIMAAELAMQNADVLIVARYLTPSEVAIYFAAAKTMGLILFVHYAVGSAAAGRFAQLNARGDRAALEAFVRDAVRWTFWPSLAAALLLLAAGWPLLRLFGPEFTSAYGVMAVLVLGFMARSSFGPSEMLLNMLGKQRICAALLVATAVLNVALNLALVPPFGLYGAAFASALSLTAGALMSWVAARVSLGLDISVWSLLQRRYVPAA